MAALQSTVKCDSRNTVKLPNEVSFMSAAPFGLCWTYSLEECAKDWAKEWCEWACFVSSGGGTGHLGIQFAKSVGLKVIGVDVKDKGLELSKKYGADIVVDARKGKADVVKEIHAVTG